MNKTKIEWTDYSWNPITGCTKGCHYCYARRMANRLRGRAGYSEIDPFIPSFHSDRLPEPLKTQRPSMIFTCSMGDFFGPEVLESWREDVYAIMEKTPWHTYQVLTKRVLINPTMREFIPKNMWVGISIDGTSGYWKESLKALKGCNAERKFISFEPLLGNDVPDNFSMIDWAIIGAQTGPGARPPDKLIVRKLAERLQDGGIPIFVKPNIRKHFKATKDRHWVTKEEFPEMTMAES